ncbi:hypothetical protein JCM11251_003009 [Rhodosporidiobolus azoricus]
MPVVTRAARQRNAAKLTNMPVEVLEEIFDIAYAEKPPSGPICRTLLPFHRRRISHLSLPGDLKQKHRDLLFTSLDRLTSLKLVGCKDVVRQLTALPRPANLLRLELLRCTLKPPGKSASEAQVALSNILSNFSSLRVLRLASPYDARSPMDEEKERETFEGLPLSLPSLPLEHLSLGQNVLLDASQLLELIKGRFPDSLKHLTLDFFDGDYGREGDRCWSWRQLLESWHLPKWRSGFDREDLEAVFEAAEERGIKVDGTVRSAADVEDAFRDAKEEYWELQEERDDEWGYERNNWW